MSPIFAQDIDHDLDTAIQECHSKKDAYKDLASLLHQAHDSICHGSGFFAPFEHVCKTCFDKANDPDREYRRTMLTNPGDRAIYDRLLEATTDVIGRFTQRCGQMYGGIPAGWTPPKDYW